MAPTDEQFVSISAKVPARLIASLKDAAQRADRSFSAELRRALRQYVEAQDSGGATSR
jgi:predicted transcriptional regulator